MTKPITKEFFAFNTINTITAYTDAPDILEGAFELCSRYELLFSRTHPDSQIKQINDAGGKPVTVDIELAEFIKTALLYCQSCDGLFDITMGSVVREWDFKEGHIPEPSRINEALTHVDYRKVHVDGTTVALDDPCASIDLGGIAKGYIADSLLEYMRSHEVESGLVNLGGNVAVLGTKPDGCMWSIGIRMPMPSTMQAVQSVFATVSVSDMSVVTSGIYERSFMRDDVLYHHILDPETGFPAQTDLLGATIISEKSLDADGYTTALIIMGLDRALEFVEGNPSIEAVFVNLNGEIYASSHIGEAIPFQVVE